MRILALLKADIANLRAWLVTVDHRAWWFLAGLFFGYDYAAPHNPWRQWFKCAGIVAVFVYEARQGKVSWFGVAVVVVAALYGTLVGFPDDPYARWVYGGK